MQLGDQLVEAAGRGRAEDEGKGRLAGEIFSLSWRSSIKEMTQEASFCLEKHREIFRFTGKNGILI